MAKSKSDLDFPDTGRREPGQIRADTVQAMRDAKGDRRVAAATLGVSMSTLSSRLHVIRSLRSALEDK